MKKNKKLLINFDRLKKLTSDRRQTVVGGTGNSYQQAESCGDDDASTGAHSVRGFCGVRSM